MRPHLTNVREVHLCLHFLIVGMLFGTGFAESAFVKDTTDLAKPLFSRVDNSKSIDFTISVSTELWDEVFFLSFNFNETWRQYVYVSPTEGLLKFTVQDADALDPHSMPLREFTASQSTAHFPTPGPYQRTPLAHTYRHHHD